MLMFTGTATLYNVLSALISQDQNDRSQLSSFRSMFGFLGALILSVSTMPLVKSFGDGKKGWLIVAIIYGIAPTDITMIIVGLVIKGLGSAGFLVSAFAMLGDTVEYGQWKHGIRIEGLTFAAEGFAEKVGTGLGGAVLGAILGVGGYIGGQATQSASAILAMKVSFAYAPIVIAVFTAVLLYFYDLDKIYPKIVAELKERNNKA